MRELTEYEKDWLARWAPEITGPAEQLQVIEYYSREILACDERQAQ